MSTAVPAEGPFEHSVASGCSVSDRESWSPVPLFPAPLVGREREIASLRTLLLRPDVPTVTLTGPGGVGKTRLAVGIAEELTAACPDGVAFVPLAAVWDPARVLPAIATALGVRESGDRPLGDRLAELLRDRTMLLVLDNLEQVLTAAPEIAALLTSSRHLTILATSRAALRISGEHAFDVPPLELSGGSQESGEHASFTETARSEAV